MNNGKNTECTHVLRYTKEELESMDKDIIIERDLKLFELIKREEKLNEVIGLILAGSSFLGDAFHILQSKFKQKILTDKELLSTTDSSIIKFREIENHLLENYSNIIVNIENYSTSLEEFLRAELIDNGGSKHE